MDPSQTGGQPLQLPADTGSGLPDCQPNLNRAKPDQNRIGTVRLSAKPESHQAQSTTALIEPDRTSSTKPAGIGSTAIVRRQRTASARAFHDNHARLGEEVGVAGHDAGPKLVQLAPRILYLAGHFMAPPFTAGSSRPLEVARRFVADGHQVTLLSTDAFLRDAGMTLSDIPHDLLGGVDVVLTPSGYSNDMGFTRRKVEFLNQATRQALIALRGDHDLVYATSTPLTVLGPALARHRLRGTPFAFEARDIWPQAAIEMGALDSPWQQWAAHSLADAGYANAIHTITLSEGMRDMIAARGVDRADISVAHNAADVTVAHNAADPTILPSQSAVTAAATHPGTAAQSVIGFLTGAGVASLYAGTLGKANDVEWLVEVVSRVDPDIDLRLAIVGTGSETAALRRAIADAPQEVAARIGLFESMSKGELFAVMTQVDLAFSTFADRPSLTTNSPNKVFDAWAMGIPVAINNGGWLADELDRHGAGIALPRDLDTAATSLTSWLATPGALAAAAVAARRRATDVYNWDHTYAVIRAALATALTRDGRVTAPARTPAAPSLRGAADTAVVSTVHNGQDTRVLRRTTIALADTGARVSYVTADPPPSPALDDRAIEVVALDPPVGRLDRITRIQWQALQATIDTGARIVHLHDPELLPTALVLRAMGRGIVFDLHEDLAAQVLLKDWIAPRLRPLVRAVVTAVETVLPHLVDEVVVADPDLAARLVERGATNITLVQNHPDLAELPDAAPPRRPRQVAYVGGVTAARGLFTMIEAVRISQDDNPFSLVVGGAFPSPDIEARAREAAQGLDVEFTGWMDRASVWKLLLSSSVGLAILDRTPNYERAQPTKVYEYLAAGMEVIASDFSLWRRLFTGVEQVHFVEPGDPVALASEIQTCLADEPDAQSRAALRTQVEESWSWAVQRASLIGVHQRLRTRLATRRGGRSSQPTP